MNPRRVLTAAAAVLALTIVSACGKRAVMLDQPPPLWGAKAKADYEAKKAEEQQKKHHKGGPDSAAPASAPASSPDSSPQP